LINVNWRWRIVGRDGHVDLSCNAVKLNASRVSSENISSGLKNIIAVTQLQIKGAFKIDNLRLTNTTTKGTIRVLYFEPAHLT
jgi:hypothetical protein